MSKNNMRVALVIGASSGIGEANAERLAKAGYGVCANTVAAASST